MKKLINLITILLFGTFVSAQSAWFDCLVYSDNQPDTLGEYINDLPGPLYIWYDAEDSTINQEWPGEIITSKIQSIEILKSSIKYEIKDDSPLSFYFTYYPAENIFTCSKTIIKDDKEMMIYVKFDRILGIYTETGFDTRKEKN